MVEEDLGEATIVYEHPDDGTVEETVANEYIAYFQDHWVLKTGEGESGRDQIRRIPAQRVYFVERSVEEFEDEIKTVTDQVRSITEDLRRKIPVGGGGPRGTGREEPVDIHVEGDPAADTDRGGESDDVDADTSENET